MNDLYNKSNTDVSIIIVNYNTREITKQCIDSVFEKTQGVRFEVILVDNGSTDGSKEAFEHDKRIRYIYSERNGGFGYGNNRGMEVAKGKYFFLLNSDTLLVNNAVYEFYQHAEHHGPKTIYGCWLRGDDGTYRGSFFFFPAFTIGQFVRRIVRGQDYTPTWDDREVECITGADMFLPRTAWEETGGFDETIFLYGEEGEWQYRLARLGYARRLIPGPKIIHLEGKSSTQSDRKRQISRQSHFYTLRKYMNPLTYVLARLYYFFQFNVLGK